MATNIGPKIGIDGEKEYRQQINLIIQQSKTLAAEMKAVTSAFTKDTSAKEKSKKVGEVLTKQIETQRKRVEELAKMTEESAKATGENSKETLSWREALNNATAQLNQLEKGLKADGVATKEYTNSVSGADKESRTFKDTLKALLVDGAIKKGVEALKNGFHAVGEAVKAAARAAGEFIKDSVNVGMEFDKSISQVAATMGTTTAQIGELRDLAKQLGSTTAFTATEAAEGLNYMALAGYDAATSMQMLPKVLDLAAAGNFDLATASDMLTDTQSALGLSIEETTALIDQMAVTASTTNTDVAGLGDAMLTVGGTAKFMKGGTMEVTRALGILADNGIKASEGGTHLRNMLLKLADPTEDGASALKSLGVEVFDASGQMRSFADIFPELNAGLSSLTDEQKLTALGQIFNTRDIAAAQALLGTSVERWEELGSAIEDSAGAAQKMADTQLDNLAGDVTKFKSALEGVKLSISDGASPALRSLVQEGTKGLETITNMLNDEAFMGSIAEIVSALSEIVQIILPQILPIIAELLPLMGELAKDILPLIFDALNEILPPVIELVKDLMPFLKEVLGIILPILTRLLSAIMPPILKIIRAILPVITGILKVLEPILNLIIDIIDPLLEVIADILSPLLDLLAPILQLLGSVLAPILRELGPLIEIAFWPLKTIVIPLLNGVVDALKSVIGWIKDAVDWFGKLFGASNKASGVTGGRSRRSVETPVRSLNTAAAFNAVAADSPLASIGQPMLMRAPISPLAAANTMAESLSATMASGLGRVVLPTREREVNNVTNYGGVTIEVHAAKGQDANEIANVVMRKMQSAVNRREAVFA